MTSSGSETSVYPPEVADSRFVFVVVFSTDPFKALVKTFSFALRSERINQSAVARISSSRSASSFSLPSLLVVYLSKRYSSSALM